MKLAVSEVSGLAGTLARGRMPGPGRTPSMSEAETLRKVESTEPSALHAAEGEVRNQRLEAIVAELLVELGVDLREPHFRGTPARVARLYRELTKGYGINPAEILKTFPSDHRELIVVSNIDFHSLCPHQMLVYRGTMHLGYIPDQRIVGLSKIPRLIHSIAARLIMQEDLVSEIADAFMAGVKPLGCAVRATGQHDCVVVRGVKSPRTTMSTVALRGIFKEKTSLTEEFYQIIAQNRE